MAKDSFVRAKPDLQVQCSGQSSQIPFSMFGRSASGVISYEQIDNTSEYVNSQGIDGFNRRIIVPGSQTDEHAATPMPSRSSG